MVQRQQTRRLTPLELEIMKVLWEAGPCTVQAVQGRLPQEPRLAYTTVQTMLNVLHRKGKVTRALRNRAYEYRAAVSRHEAVRQAICDLVDRLFSGSAESLVMSLVETRQLSAETLARLTDLVNRSKDPKTRGRKPD